MGKIENSGTRGLHIVDLRVDSEIWELEPSDFGDGDGLLSAK